MSSCPISDRNSWLASIVENWSTVLLKQIKNQLQISLNSWVSLGLHVTTETIQYYSSIDFIFLQSLAQLTTGFDNGCHNGCVLLRRIIDSFGWVILFCLSLCDKFQITRVHYSNSRWEMSQHVPFYRSHAWVTIIFPFKDQNEAVLTIQRSCEPIFNPWFRLFLALRPLLRLNRTEEEIMYLKVSFEILVTLKIFIICFDRVCL